MFISYRHDDDLACAFHARLTIYGQRSLPVGRSVQQSINIVGRLQLDTVDRDDVVADGDIGARRGEWCAQFRVPILVVINPRDFVASILDCEVRAEQSTL